MAFSLRVLRIKGDGSADEVYNGPAEPVWRAAGKVQSNWQRVVSVSRLVSLQAKVQPEDKLLEASERRQ